MVPAEHRIDALEVMETFSAQLIPSLCYCQGSSQRKVKCRWMEGDASGDVPALCWAVSKKHRALKEWICCRFVNLTELRTFIAQKATGRLFCTLHGRDSPVLAVKSSYAMLPAAAETSGSDGQFSMKLVGKLCMYLWKVYIQCHVHVPFFYTLFPCSEKSPVKCLWRKCS